MRGVALVLLVLVALGGGAAYLASQPTGDPQPIQPSTAAAAIGATRIVAAFKVAGLKAALTGRQQPVSVSLSDLELTSIADAWLAAQPGAAVHDLTLHGTSGGVFQAGALVDWNGVTLHVYEAGTVSFGSDGSLQPSARDASIGRLPLPPALVNSLVAQNAPAYSPPHLVNVSLQPVDGGGVLSGTVTPGGL